MAATNRAKEEPRAAVEESKEKSEPQDIRSLDIEAYVGPGLQIPDHEAVAQ